MPNIFHVIKDPVHGTMQFTSLEDAWIKPFIDSQHFQRLRHIKQLGMSDYIFPGASHSRFNHCLGCCYVAGQIAHKIGLADEERQLVMIACLLHDIGHGPFSHTFEDISKVILLSAQGNKQDVQNVIHHEDWTPFFLADYAEAFFSQYNKANPRYPLGEEKFQDIAHMIMHRQKSKSVLADIVSSQLDADRLDYLLRDSHFCGVRYGEFDFRWMLHCMAIVPTNAGDRLGITHKGIGVVEHYLMARRLMIRNIYHSPKKLALEAFLVQLLAMLSETLAQDEASYRHIRETRLGQFLIAIHRFSQMALHKQNKQDFLRENYENYSQLYDYDFFILIKQLSELNVPTDPIVQLAVRIQQRQTPKIVRLESRNLAMVMQELQMFKNQHKEIKDWQLMLMQSPLRAYSGEEDPIFVMDENNRIRTLDKFSIMIDAISDKFEQTAFLCIDKAIMHDKNVQKFLQHLESDVFF